MLPGPRDYRRVEGSRSATDRVTRQFYFIASFALLQDCTGLASIKETALKGLSRQVDSVFQYFGIHDRSHESCFNGAAKNDLVLQFRV